MAMDYESSLEKELKELDCTTFCQSCVKQPWMVVIVQGLCVARGEIGLKFVSWRNVDILNT